MCLTHISAYTLTYSCTHKHIHTCAHTHTHTPPQTDTQTNILPLLNKYYSMIKHVSLCQCVSVCAALKFCSFFVSPSVWPICELYCYSSLTACQAVRLSIFLSAEISVFVCHPFYTDVWLSVSWSVGFFEILVCIRF